ncbi:MAG: cytochrome c3 family protein [Actinomycetes bacterium]
MKKILLLGVGSALMFTMGGVGPAVADAGPHRTTAVADGATALVSVAGGGRCASCHRAHTAKAEMLLKDSQPALCYTCHGGSASSIDVIDGVNNDDGLALRGGGFEYTLMNGALATKTIGPALVPDPITGVMPPSYTQLHSATAPVGAVPALVTSRHQIDGTTTGTMWGNGAVSATVNPGKAGVTLECSSCHDPHGNGNYRILKALPADSDATVPVNIPDATTKVYTTADYWLVTDRNVPTVAGGALPTAAQTDGYIANVAAWCTTCHTRYLAGSGSYNTPLKDAAGVTDALFTYRHRSDRSDAAGISRPNCIQCHVSHGTSANMTLTSATFTAPDGQVPTAKGGIATPYTTQDGTAKTVAGSSPVGTSRLLRVDNRGTCVMCHNV